MKKGRKSGEITEEDAILWETVSRTVRPYSRKKATSPPPHRKTEPVKKQKYRLLKDPILKPPPAAPEPPKGFDKSTEAKLKRGQLSIEGRLDLHGMTQEKALTALRHFIRKAYSDNRRTLLVITGKGDREKNTGVLRRMLPLWLETGDLRQMVLALSQAKPKDGGNGAFYIRLRKN